MGCAGSSSSGGKSRGGSEQLNIRELKKATSPVSKLSEYKICVIGTYGVGKSSVVNRYCHGTFSTTHMTTIGAAFSSKEVTLHGAPKVKGASPVLRLQIWDTGGEERYRSMTKFYVRNCCAALLVYDVQERKSFDELRSWLDFFRAECPDSLVVVAGNKCDAGLEPQRKAVPRSLAATFADENQLTHFECSARDNRNIEEMFAEIAGQAYRSDPYIGSWTPGQATPQADSAIGAAANILDPR